MKRMMTILTLCTALVSVAYGLPFSNITPGEFTNGNYNVVAWGDVDGNGYNDLFLGGMMTTESKLYLSIDASWVDVSTDYSVDEITRVNSARFVDFDSDGQLDLFCLTGNADGAELYRLNENERYQRVALNVDQSTGRGIHSAAWCDTDGNGTPELLLSNRSSAVDGLVMLTQETEEFTEVRGADDGPFTETSVARISPVDFDQDGDLDYYISKYDAPVSLWKNSGGVFHNLNEEIELPTKVGTKGMTWADFNRDGLLDFFGCGSIDNQVMFYQRPPADLSGYTTFEDMSTQYPAFEQVRGVHSAHAVDMDGDGWTDLFLARNKGAGNVILLNRPEDGWKVLEVNPLQYPELGCRSAAWCDYDNDGDLDVAMAQGTEGVTLYRNDQVLANEYIGLKLCGFGESTTPVLDCLVEVNFPSGKQWAATSMYATTADAATKFIYNVSSEHSEAYEVRIAWPNGARSIYNQNQIVLWATNVLHMPTLPTPGRNENLASLMRPTVPELGNYPNPFNPTTNVNFVLPEAANVSLTVFNLLGQQVATLASGNFEAGSHSLVFDASSLSSGLYLVRLEAPGQSVVHRMLLSK